MALNIELSGQYAAERPLAVDLFCGLGGWTDGLLAENYRVIGFDIERHVYGEHRYPAQLVIQDVLTLHGSQFKDAELIVCSPPCQEYSYMAMPWSRAKAKAAAIRADTTGKELVRLNRLFMACFRIQREACEAAGRHIPMVVENVRGAIPWVGRSRWNFGSYHLWGDVPALMPATFKAKQDCEVLNRNGHNIILPQVVNREGGLKVSGFRFDGSGKSFQSASVEGCKNAGGSWFRVSHNNVPHSRGDAVEHTPHMTNSGEHGSKGFNVTAAQRYRAILADGSKGGGDWFGSGDDCSIQRRHGGSKSDSRKAASAMIAKIPEPLARWIARCFLPRASEAA